MSQSIEEAGARNGVDVMSGTLYRIRRQGQSKIVYRSDLYIAPILRHPKSGWVEPEIAGIGHGQKWTPPCGMRHDHRRSGQGQYGSLKFVD